MQQEAGSGHLTSAPEPPQEQPNRTTGAKRKHAQVSRHQIPCRETQPGFNDKAARCSLIATQISAGSVLGRAPFTLHAGLHPVPGGRQEAGCEPQEAALPPLVHWPAN